MRNPKRDPQAGDILTFKGGWRLVVLRRDGEVVRYAATNKKVTRESAQSILQWQQWSVKAKIETRTGVEMECAVTWRVSGPCSKCGGPVDGQAHLPDVGGVFCGGHCPSKKHGTPTTK